MTIGMIFDMDGVLFDSHPIHLKAWRELFLGVGKLVSEEELDFILEGPTREEILRHFLGPLPQERIRHYAKKKDLLFRKGETNLRAIGGVLSFLDTAEVARIPKVIATSASRMRAQRMLNRHRFIDRFAALVTGDDVQNGKSDPAIFLCGAEKLGATPCKIVVFEDAASAIRAATSVGMKCVGVATGRRRLELHDAGAEIVISDFTEIGLPDVYRLFE